MLPSVKKACKGDAPPVQRSTCQPMLTPPAPPVSGSEPPGLRRLRREEWVGTALRAFDLVRGVPRRSSLFLEYDTDIVFPRTFRMGYEAVRTERYTCIVDRELPGMDERYDLQRDPYRMDKLIGTPRAETVLPGVRAELQRLITAASAR
jgi:hypothetical protein